MARRVAVPAARPPASPAAPTPPAEATPPAAPPPAALTPAEAPPPKKKKEKRRRSKSEPPRHNRMEFGEDPRAAYAPRQAAGMLCSAMLQEVFGASAQEARVWCVDHADVAFSVELPHLARNQCGGVNGKCLAERTPGVGARPYYGVAFTNVTGKDRPTAVARLIRGLRETRTAWLCGDCGRAHAETDGWFMFNMHGASVLCCGPGGRGDPDSFCLRNDGFGCLASFALGDVGGSVDEAAIGAEYDLLNEGRPQERNIFCAKCAEEAADQRGGTVFPIALHGRGDRDKAIKRAKKKAEKVAEKLGYRGP